MTGPQPAVFHDLLEWTNRFLVERTGLVVDHFFARECQVEGFNLGLYELTNPIKLFLEVWIDAEIGHCEFPLVKICLHGRPGSRIR